MELDFGCFMIESVLNSRSQETENQVFVLKSMRPGNQIFCTVSGYLLMTNMTSVRLKSMGPITCDEICDALVWLLRIYNMSKLLVNLLQ